MTGNKVKRAQYPATAQYQCLVCNGFRGLWYLYRRGVPNYILKNGVTEPKEENDFVVDGS